MTTDANTEAPRTSQDQALVHRLYDSPMAMPRDLQEKATRRLGWLALALAISWLTVRIINLGFDFANDQAGFVGADLVTAVALVLSGCMFATTRIATLTPRLILDVGLVYVVIMAFLISLVENYSPWPEGHILRGAPYVCWWIMLWPALIPATPRKIIVVSALSAMSAPVALKLSVVAIGNPEQPFQLYLRLFLTGTVAIIPGFITSRVLSSLSADVSRAREMGSYKLLRRIGTGGMGDVWSAEHKTLARPAALKIIRADSLGESLSAARTVLARFEREARATAALRSPHTIELYDFGTTDDGTFYYVMELLHGFELEQLVRKFGPLPSERVAHILEQVCHSLYEAHTRNLVHRDVKPANIFVCRYGADFDFVKVLDFGLVKSEFEPREAKLTAEGMTSGTPAYMAPEMARGGHGVGPEADIYGLGCVAYYLLTGKLVFEATSAMKMMLKQIEEDPVPPSERLGTPVHEGLEALVMQCLEKDPANRPQSARILAKALAALVFDNPWDEARAEDWWRTRAPDDASIALEQLAETNSGSLVPQAFFAAPTVTTSSPPTKPGKLPASGER